MGQTTPQRITNEEENEATSNHNIFQRLINDAENETTSNHNIFQGIINEAESETTTNHNIFQGLINEAESETTSNHNHNHNIKPHQATLKRLMDNNEREATSPKRPNRNDKITDEAMIIDDIALSPGWNKKFLSTVTSPIKETHLDKIKENHLDKIKQIINQKIKPTTPTRKRTRSQEQKETPTKNEQNHKNSRTRSQDTKDKPINAEQIINLIENQHDQGKVNLKGPQQTKQNHNAR